VGASPRPSRGAGLDQQFRIRRDDRLERSARLDGGESVGGALEGIAAAHHLAPRFVVAMPGGERYGAVEVIVPCAPAAFQFDVLAIELPVRVNLHRTVVGVVAADHDTAAVAHHVERLRHGVRRAARFDHDVGTASASELAHARPAIDVAPMRRAKSSRAAGAPTAISSPAPESDANATHDCPTGPAPSTTTDSSSLSSAMSTAWSAVTRPQPPPMNVSGARFGGSLIIFTPGFIQIARAQPPSKPSAALYVMPYTLRLGHLVGWRATRQ